MKTRFNLIRFAKQFPLRQFTHRTSKMATATSAAIARKLSYFQMTHSPSIIQQGTKFTSHTTNSAAHLSIQAEHKAIPDLPLLKQMATTARANGFPSQERTAVIGIQHMVPTTATLFDTFINELGVKPENMFFNGKFYSSCDFVEDYIRSRKIHLGKTRMPEVPGQFDLTMGRMLEDLWDNLAEHLSKNPEIDKIIIIDEGGYCGKSMPKWLPFKYQCAGIEHTRYGFYKDFYNYPAMPIVDMARSIIKTALEPQFIVDTVLKRIEHLLTEKELKLNSNSVMGVVGNGAIGSALAKFLLERGFIVLVYDENEKAFDHIKSLKFYRSESIGKLINNANVIFGCTGKDITLENIKSFLKVGAPIKLISCSSQEIEFQTLLKEAGNRSFVISPMSDTIKYLNMLSDERATITLVEQGYPINFSRTADCDPPDEMLLTRMLLLGSFIQATTIAETPIKDGITPMKERNIHKLNPTMQKRIVQHWKESKPASRLPSEVLKNFESTKWISENSSGKDIDNEFLEKCFEKNISQCINESNPLLSRFKF